MLIPLTYLGCCVVISVIIIFIQYRLYKENQLIRDLQMEFIKSSFFAIGVKEILLVMLACFVANVFTSNLELEKQLAEEEKSRANIINTYSSFQSDIRSEYKFNEKFIQIGTGLQATPSDIKNGEDFINSLLHNDIIATDLSEEIRDNLNQEGRDLRSAYNALQDAEDSDQIREIVEHINSSYDNVLYMLELLIEYQRNDITQYDVTVQYERHLAEKRPVKTLPDVGFRITVEVRADKDEDRAWKMTTDAQIGDIVEFLVEYRNISDDIQQNVMMQTILPQNMKYLPGTTTLYNGKYPYGTTFVSDDLFADGLNIGNYGPKVTAYVSFKAEVVNVCLQPGSNTLVSWTQCCVGGICLQDYACVTLQQ